MQGLQVWFQISIHLHVYLKRILVMCDTVSNSREGLTIVNQEEVKENRHVVNGVKSRNFSKGMKETTINLSPGVLAGWNLIEFH
jgi:hypothetical protein